MGYACPVCATPQADDEHLANHLAFTALLGDEDHETWLDEHVPGWEDVGPAELAPDVTEYADETEYDEVFEDTTDRQPRSSTPADGHDDHDHGGDSFEDRMARELGVADGDAQDRQHDHGEHGPELYQQRPSSERSGQTGAIDVAGADSLDDEAREILEEAHEMTKEMYGEEGDTDAEDAGKGAETETEGESE